MKFHQLQLLFYVSLFVLAGCSLSLFLFFFFFSSDEVWNVFNRVYLFLLLGYTWYVFILLYLEEHKKGSYPAYNDEKISVIIPCYNEDPKNLEKTVISVVKAKGNKKVYLINDGSKGEYVQGMKDLAEKYNVTYFGFDLNKGKRHALHTAVTSLIGASDFIVTIDSDTVLTHTALIKIVEPLKVDKIAAATGDVRLANEKQNLLTRMVGAYYWVGLQIYKKAQSNRGFVMCCSGCLAAYRASVLKEIIDDFIEQEFFGEKCTHSEDRHLTNLVLKKGYNVVFVPNAISYTVTPHTVSGFVKQQQR